MANEYKIKYEGAPTELVITESPSRVIPEKATIAWAYSDATGRTYKKSLRRRVKFTWEWDLVSEEQVSAIEQYLDAAEDAGVETLQVTSFYPGKGIRTFNVYREADTTFEPLNGKNWRVNHWRYSVTFNEPVGEQLNGIKDLI